MFSSLMFSGLMANTWIAASIVAVIAGLTGFFAVLRGETFAAHAIPNGAFAGAAGASLLGINVIWGLAVFAVGGDKVAARNVASDLFLRRLNPKFTLPRRATGKKFVKDYEETATTALAKRTPDRQRRKRQPTFLITVVDVMQDHVSGPFARCAALGGHRRYFESFFF